LFSAYQAAQRFAFNVYARLALKANSFIRFPKVFNGVECKTPKRYYTKRL